MNNVEILYKNGSVEKLYNIVKIEPLRMMLIDEKLTIESTAFTNSKGTTIKKYKSEIEDYFIIDLICFNVVYRGGKEKEYTFENLESLSVKEFLNQKIEYVGKNMIINYGKIVSIKSNDILSYEIN